MVKMHPATCRTVRSQSADIETHSVYNGVSTGQGIRTMREFAAVLIKHREYCGAR
jgi:hypothetical protein